jgi:hypothetical protein
MRYGQEATAATDLPYRLYVLRRVNGNLAGNLVEIQKQSGRGFVILRKKVAMGSCKRVVGKKQESISLSIYLSLSVSIYLYLSLHIYTSRESAESIRQLSN